MKTKSSVLYGIDEPLVLLPLDKANRGTRSSCVVLRARGLFRDLSRFTGVTSLHHRILSTSSVVGTLLNFKALHASYWAVVPHSKARIDLDKALEKKRVVFVHGAAIDVLKQGGVQKWRHGPVYHYDAAARGDLTHFRIGIGNGSVYSADATAYYCADLIAKMTYQFLEEPNEATRRSTPESG